MKGPVAERDIRRSTVADYDGANQTRVTDTASLDIAPVWSPDGSADRLYLAGGSGYPGHHRVLHHDRQPAQTPAQGPSEKQNYLPAWSPDGTKIAFTSSRDGNQEIYVDEPGRQRPAAADEPARDRRDADVVADRHADRVRFGSHRAAADLHHERRRHRAEPDHQRNALRSRRPGRPRRSTRSPTLSQSGGGYDIKVYEFATGQTAHRSPTASAATRARRSRRTAGTSRSCRIARAASRSSRSTRRQRPAADHQGGQNKYPNWSQ